MKLTAVSEAYFAAVRDDDVPGVERLPAQVPELVKARWRGHSGNGLIRSFGPPPYNPWHPAPVDAAHPDDPLIWTRHDGMARVLVEHGADVNARGTSGDLELLDWFYTPLWRAAHDNRIDTVRLLVERGADVNVSTPDGSNQALKTAAENGAVEVCKYLLAQGAQPDFITAAMLGLVEAISALLEGDPTLVALRDSHGRSALDAATLLDSFRVP